MRVARRIVLVSLLAGLTACDTVGGWFGSAEDPPLPGQRISVLELAGGLEPSPELANTAVVLPAAAANEAWPQAGMVPTHTPGHLALALPLEQAWSVNIGTGSSRERRLISAPVVAGGVVFAMDADGRISALDAGNGRQLWRVRAATPDEDSAVLGGGLAYADGLLFATTGFGEIMALDPSNGGQVWRAAASGPVRSAPTVSGGRVFVVSVDNQIEALDAATGEALWSHTGILENAGILGGASPAVGGGIVVVPYSSGEVYALRVETGRPVWSDSLAAIRRVGAMVALADILAHPVIDDNLVLAVGHSDRSAALDLRGGVRVWEQDVGGVNMPWVAGDYAFVLTRNAEIVALTRQGGAIRWVAPLPRWTDPEDREGPIVWTGPVLAGGRLIVVGSEGEGLLINPETGAIDGGFALRGDAAVAPVVAQGTLFVLSDNGILTAYR